MKSATIQCASLFLISGSLIAMTPIALAQCKPMSANYEIVDLGDFEQSDDGLRAVAIDNKGRKIIRFAAQGINGDSREVMVSARGKVSQLKQADDGAVRETLKFLDNGNRIVAYSRYDPSFRPVEMQTLIDRRGGEIAVKDYCQSPSEGWQQVDFKISRSGKKAAATFMKDGRFALAACNEDMTSERRFERDHEILLTGITDAGIIGGKIDLPGKMSFWRLTNELDEIEAPDGYSNIEASGMDEAGNIIATTTGEITSAPLRYTSDGIEPLSVLPGKGWDVLWQVQAPCGEIFGQAVHTNIEEFLDLPQEEQDAMRDDMRAFLQFAEQREDAYFLWDPELKGRFMSSVVAGFRDWQDVRISSVNERGVAVGYALNADNETRAIAIRPVT
jgi:hypothetical protein